MLIDDIIVAEMRRSESRLTLDERAEKLNLQLAELKRLLLSKRLKVVARDGMLRLQCPDEMNFKLDAEEAILDELHNAYESTYAFLADIRNAAELMAVAGAHEEAVLMRAAHKTILRGLQQMNEVSNHMACRRGLVVSEENDFRLVELEAKEKGQ
jgi:hypothetical protein